MTARILIVDDEPDIRELVELTLTRMGHTTDTAKNIEDAKKQLAAQQYALCLTDMRLPDGDGLDLIQLITETYTNTQVAMITAYGDMQTAISAMKAGAFDFISKPIDLNNLRNIVSQALNQPQSIKNTQQKPHDKDYTLIGNSQPMQQLKTLINKVARSQAPVYILGESGTGKELVARNIHQQSNRSEGEFVAVNCSAIPSELVESEFFGHVKGSFTGAHKDKKGLFEQANGGTLFLDEVADLVLPMQAKLLRAIQERKIKPVGANQEKSVNVRILSASHKSLKQLVKAGTFREDLYYRINVIEIQTPPLRERVDDIQLLADAFLRRLSNREKRTQTLELSNDAVGVLKQQYFAGNVRELENLLERAAALCENHCIEIDDLDVIDSADTTAATHADSPEIPSLKSIDKSSSNDERNEGSANNNKDLSKQLEDSERASIEAALEKTRWNRTEAAKLLGLTFRQLRYRIQKLDIK